MKTSGHLGRTAIVAAALIVALTGCKGPTGPQGPAGHDGTPGTSCTVTSNTDGSKTIDCGTTQATITNGVKGDPGQAGSAGTSCTAASVTGGVEITCGTNVFTLTNGEQGLPGTPGQGCTVVDNGNGADITCGATTVIVSNGPQGPDGLAGASCSAVTLFDGTKTVECTDGTSFIVVASSNLLAWDAALPGVKVSVLSASGGSLQGGNFQQGDTVRVTFAVTDGAGVPIPLPFLARARAWLSGPTTAYQHVLPEAAEYLDLKRAGVATDNGDGTYSADLAVLPAVYPAQLGSTGAFPEEGSLVGTPLQDGTYTLSLVARRTFNVDGRSVNDVGFAQADLLVGAPTVPVGREVVLTASCNNCHGEVRGHGGGYRSVALCVTCHTAGAEVASTLPTLPAPTAAQQSIDFGVMIHKLHAGAHLPSVLGIGVDPAGNRTYGAGTPYALGTTDFSAVLFPVFPNFAVALPKDLGYSALSSANKTKEDTLRKGVTNCGVCHAGAADGGNAYARASRKACGACHDDVKWGQDYVHNGNSMGPQSDDSGCVDCHGDVADRHVHPIDSAANPGLAFGLSAVTGGTVAAPAGNFKAGDRISVTFALQDAAGNALPPSALDSVTAMVVGPNQNRNAVFPMASASSLSVTPFDASSGRLVSAGATTGGSGAAATAKGSMSKVSESAVGPFASAALKVQFTGPLAFDVTDAAGTPLGSGALAGPSAYPSGVSVGSIVLAADAVPEQVAVVFSTSTAFAVTGSVSGDLGGGELPAATSASTLFRSWDGKVQFTVAANTNAATAGTTIRLTVFQAAAANPVLFAVVNGSLPFAAGDRFYYDYLAPSAGGSYTLPVPMDIPWEGLGYGNATPPQALTAAANLPVSFGRQTVYQLTPSATAFSLALPAAKAFDRWAFLTDVGTGASAIKSNDFLIVDPGTASEEVVRVSGTPDPATRRVAFATVLRYPHNPGAAVRWVPAAGQLLLQEAIDYTLVPATGVVTLLKSVPATDLVAMTYRTAGAFGWRRKAGDAVQAVYGPSVNTTGAYGEPWGVWSGKPYVDGTYSVSLWGYRNLYWVDGEAPLEVQTYRATSVAAQRDFLYGAASTVTPYGLIESDQACNRCHYDLVFHGGGRRGGNACLACHAAAGLENGSGVNYTFRYFLHQAHAEALPSMRGGSQDCGACHGTATAWKVPTDHTYPGRTTSPITPAATVPTWNHSAACSGCHDVLTFADGTNRGGGAHIDAQISQFTQAESCLVCHSAADELRTDRVHRTR